MIQDPNISTVELAAAELGPLIDELVLVGGCAVGLLVTDQARPPVRQTTDVDLIVEIAPITRYYAFCERLKDRGFSEQPTADVLCRWAKGRLLVDVMPTESSVLGFTNSWYAVAARSATKHVLPSGRSLRLVSGPAFLATKLEAFSSRGKGDFLHHDMEDIVTLIDGRASIVEEVLRAENELREYLMEEFEGLLADATFVDRLSWLLHPQDLQSRVDIVLKRIRTIAGL